jgi:hypothetical protein
MTRPEAMGHRGRGGFRVGRAVSGAWTQARDNAIYIALKEMRPGGVDIDRAPKEAVDMLIEANAPVVIRSCGQGDGGGRKPRLVGSREPFRRTRGPTRC